MTKAGAPADPDEAVGKCPHCQSERAKRQATERLIGEIKADMRQTVIDADAQLSLLRYRCASLIPWGTVSAPEMHEVEATIGKLRKLYERGGRLA